MSGGCDDFQITMYAGLSSGVMTLDSVAIDLSLASTCCVLVESATVYYHRTARHPDLRSAHAGRFGLAGTVNSVAFSPDGRRIVSGSVEGTLKIWDMSTGKETLALRGHTSGVRAAAFSPDGRRQRRSSSNIRPPRYEPQVAVS